MRPPFLRAAIVVGALGTSGALSYAASPRWHYGDTPIDRPVTITRSFITAHIGDTLINKVTTSTDSVSRSLPRPPGVPSRIVMAHCGSTRLFSRNWIGAKAASAESVFVTVTGTTAECANPPVIVIACPWGTRVDSSKWAALQANADTTTDPALTDVPCP